MVFTRITHVAILNIQVSVLAALHGLYLIEGLVKSQRRRREDPLHNFRPIPMGPTFRRWPRGVACDYVLESHITEVWILHVTDCPQPRLRITK